jgi:hypothetical protein
MTEQVNAAVSLNKPIGEVIGSNPGWGILHPN